MKSNVINSLEGKIEVQIFDKDDQLKKIVKGKNTLTVEGLKRICEILSQGVRNGISTTESIDGVPMNTLRNGENAFGINVIEWKEKEYTTFDFSENILGLNQSDVMFKNNNYSGNYSYITKNSNVNDKFDEFYFPASESGETGWICDLGIKHSIDNEYMFSENISFIQRVNVKYGSLIIKLADGKKLIEGQDYEVLSWGDYDNYVKLSVNENLLNLPVYISYSYFNVPKTPIVGFCFDSVCTDKGIDNTKNFISGWSWSLDQGKSRLPHFFPNLSGCPSGNSNAVMTSNATYNYSHQMSWFNPFGETEKRFFIHSYPYAVINPTQLAWYSHLYNSTKCYFKNFSLLGVDMPKLGPQAIKLGTGTKTPTKNDTDLFSPVEKTKTVINSKRNNGVDTITFEIKLDFEDCNSDEYFTEIGLFFPENEDVFYSDADYWNKSVEEGGCGRNNEHISGKNRIVKFDGVNKNNCNTMFSHGMFETPWTKQNNERVTILYTVKINW